MYEHNNQGVVLENGRKHMEDKMIYDECKSTKKKKSFFEKVKEHKVEIIVGGITIVSVLGVVLIVKNWDTIKGQTVTSFFKDGTKANGDTIPSVAETIENTIISIQPNGRVIDVSKHIRNLPDGWKASAEKMDSAIKSGIELGANQTWVEGYSKLCA